MSKLNPGKRPGKAAGPGAVTAGMTVFFMDGKNQYFTGIKRDFDNEKEAIYYFNDIKTFNQRPGPFMFALLGESMDAFYTDFPGFIKITGKYMSEKEIKAFHEEAWLYMEDKEGAQEQIIILAVLANKNLNHE